MAKIILSLLVAFTLVAPAAAQTTTDGFRDKNREVKEEFQKEREEFKATTTAIKEEFRTDIKTLRGEDREAFEKKREEAKDELEKRREEFKQKLENEREEVKERLETAREELKVRLKKIKDEKKVEIVGRLSGSVNSLNEKLTNHFLEVLEKLDKVLDNVTSRTDKAEAHELDVSAVRTAITAAEIAIASARGAVETQAGKTYSFNITTEENLKVDVGAARQALHNDLTAVKEIVRTAHVAVKDAAVKLAQIPRVDDLEVETDDATSTTP
ncbi:MAG: hypothetical protein V2A55_01140 [Candidatus Jorgensenbacteria bacterium]